MEWSKNILPRYILFKLNVKRDEATTSRVRGKYSSTEKHKIFIIIELYCGIRDKETK